MGNHRAVNTLICSGNSAILFSKTIWPQNAVFHIWKQCPEEYRDERCRNLLSPESVKPLFLHLAFIKSAKQSVKATVSISHTLFLAMLGLHRCAWAFSSCNAWASHCDSLSCCGAQALGTQASVVSTHGLSSCGTGLSCPMAYGIFLDQG